jgi:hypothetical protein
VRRLIKISVRQKESPSIFRGVKEMFTKKSVRSGLIIASIFIALSLPVTQPVVEAKKKTLSSGTPMIWQEQKDIASLDLYYGKEGKEGWPTGNFKFIDFFKAGKQPKVMIEDEHGVKWIAKLGKEAQPETVATRLLWAAGYFTDETYYFPTLRVEGFKVPKDEPMPGGAIIDGVIQDARLSRFVPDRDISDWSWFDNPFVETKEMDGLRVLMALINNWDLKESNNGIVHDKEAGRYYYYVHDLGATFGKTGGFISRSKNNPEDYLNSEFVEKVTPEHVDFVLKTRPPIILVLHPVYYIERAKMSEVAEDIPRSHAKWIGEILSQLSDKQIKDAFRAAGYKPDEISMLTIALKTRIDELMNL